MPTLGVKCHETMHSGEGLDKATPPPPRNFDKATLLTSAFYVESPAELTVVDTL